MQRQRGDLVPIDEVIGGLGGPVQAIRDTSPQARYHFTQADQVNQLVGASEADVDLGFMARTMALPCSGPFFALNPVTYRGPGSSVVSSDSSWFNTR